MGYVLFIIIAALMVGIDSASRKRHARHERQNLVIGS